MPRVLTPHFIANKTVLLRLDIDVPFNEINGKRVVAEDFRLKAALPSLYLCLQYAKKVIILGHVGRPEGQEVKELSVGPIVDWFNSQIPDFDFPPERLQILENLRFEKGEDEADILYAKELADLGDVYINEAFAAHHKAASTTVLPRLLPHAIGFHFDHELQTLSQVRDHPQKPLVSIIGGAKIADKLPVISTLAKVSEYVLVGGKLPHEIKVEKTELPDNVIVATMTPEGTDINNASIDKFTKIIANANQIVWSGPVGYFEHDFNTGNKALAKAVLDSKANSIIGGGDTISALEGLGVLDQFSFVSTGGGAMLEFLATGSLPTLEAMK